MSRFISIDPGTSKIGIAVFIDGEVVFHTILKRDTFLDRLKEIYKDYGCDFLVIGEGTNSKHIKEELKNQFLDVKTVKEYNSTQEAKYLYFKDNPPKGLFSLIPESLLYPSKPFDDYAAIVIGKRFLLNNGGNK